MITVSYRTGYQNPERGVGDAASQLRMEIKRTLTGDLNHCRHVRQAF